MTGQRHYGRHAVRSDTCRARAERSRRESKDIYEEEGREKARGRGETAKRRMHWQRSFATPVTRCCIYSYTAAAPTPTARSLRVSRFDEGRPRQRVGEKRGEKKKTSLATVATCTFYLLWQPRPSLCLSPFLLFSYEPRAVQENTVTWKKGERRSEIVR